MSDSVVSRLIRSRKFWIAVVTVLVTAGGGLLPASYKDALAAFQTFAMALIASYTLEDSAAWLRGKK